METGSLYIVNIVVERNCYARSELARKEASYWIKNSLIILPGDCLNCRQENTYTKSTTKG